VAVEGIGMVLALTLSLLTRLVLTLVVGVLEEEPQDTHTLEELLVVEVL
jgi:hypothetical protein